MLFFTYVQFKSYL